MATATFVVRVENNYGEFMEFDYEHVFDGPAADFDPNDMSVHQEIYDHVMRDIYVDLDFISVEE